MTKRLLVLLCSVLALSACGKKTGEGYTSGTCKKDVVEDYAKLGADCAKLQNNADGRKECKEKAEDFLEEYPGVSCEITAQEFGSEYGSNYGGTGRIEHQTIEYMIKVMNQYDSVGRGYP